MNRDVFLSILAMDSYQRGYSPGISGVNGGALGQATITNISNTIAGSDEVKAGFFASAYNWNGTTVISYRGTDFDIGAGATQFLPDFLNGWSSFTSWGTNAQYPLAEKFFNAVMDIPEGHSAFEIDGVGPVYSNVIVTGHSLGGAWAGNDDGPVPASSAA